MHLRGRRTERTDLKAQLFGSGISTRVSGRFPVPGNAASPRRGQSVGRAAEWPWYTEQVTSQHRNTTPRGSCDVIKARQQEKYCQRHCYYNKNLREGGNERNRSCWERGSWQGMSNQQAKEKELCGCIQTYFIKIATCSVFSQHSWMSGMMQLRYQGAVHRQKCILRVTVVLNK